MDTLLLAGRILFAAIFILSGPGHFTPGLVSYAANAGVPAPWFLVPAAGVLAVLGGLCVALGWRAKLGGWLLVVFLVPVTLVMHQFWGLTDPAEAMMQRVNFMKNLSMLGGALAFAYFGAGPYSLDNRRLARRALTTREREREPALR